MSDIEELGFSGAQELRRVEQETVTDAGMCTVEVRFFMSSLTHRQLSLTQKLQLVRLHWGIEAPVYRFGHDEGDDEPQVYTPTIREWLMELSSETEPYDDE